MAGTSRHRVPMSRGSRRGVWAALILLVLALSILDHRLGGPIRTTIGRWGPDWHDWRTYHGRTFAVVRVVDGDTLDIDHPDGEHETTRVRLLGVDTPEKANENNPAMYYAEQAAAFAQDLAEGEQVTIYLDDVGDVRGKYGRLLAYVELPDGSILNERLLREGYGYADTRFGHSRYARYIELQNQSRRAGAGLWAEVRPDQLPRWLQRQGLLALPSIEPPGGKTRSTGP